MSSIYTLLGIHLVVIKSQDTIQTPHLHVFQIQFKLTAFPSSRFVNVSQRFQNQNLNITKGS